MTDTKKPAPKPTKVKVGGVIADGKGDYLEKGDDLPKGADEAGLKAKGFI